MSEYGFYLNKDVAENFENGKKAARIDGRIEGFFVGSLIAVLVTAFICYRQYGPPSQVPNLSLLIGDMRRWSFVYHGGSARPCNTGVAPCPFVHDQGTIISN